MSFWTVDKRYVVGAGINTRDYAERVPALVEAGADVLCIDSSEGFSEWQKRTIDWIRENYGDSASKSARATLWTARASVSLPSAGADFVKVGIGGGSICITRETKGIGRGQATALIDVCKASVTEYFRRDGRLCPGLLRRRHRLRPPHHAGARNGRGLRDAWHAISRALTKAPPTRFSIKGTYYKEYWGEGSATAHGTGSATTSAATRSCRLRRAWTPMCLTPARLKDNVAHVAEQRSSPPCATAAR